MPLDQTYRYSKSNYNFYSNFLHCDITKGAVKHWSCGRRGGANINITETGKFRAIKPLREREVSWSRQVLNDCLPRELLFMNDD